MTALIKEFKCIANLLCCTTILSLYIVNSLGSIQYEIFSFISEKTIRIFSALSVKLRIKAWNTIIVIIHRTDKLSS
jgi:hypothetical protein